MIRQRAALDAMPSYKPGAIPQTDDVAKLSSNENPCEPLPSVVRAITGELAGINRYPSMAVPELRALLAERYDVDPLCLSFGAGSVEVLNQLIAATSGEGDEVIFAWRSFEAYPIVTVANGATPVQVPLLSDERHDLEAMAAAVTDRTRLILLCNPNNPTGATMSTAEVDAFLARVPSDILVVIDEAYVHFNRRPDSADGIDFFRRYDNVAVLHTFSKAYGLAGLRIGYAIAPLEVAENLRKVSVSFAVTALAQRAAVASLAAEAELDARVDELVVERERTVGALRAAGWSVPESEGNFFWLRTGTDTDAVNARLVEAGILVRAFAGEGIRVSIGSPEHNDRVIRVLSDLRQVAE